MKVACPYREDEALARELGYEPVPMAEVLFFERFRSPNLIRQMQTFAVQGQPLIAVWEQQDTTSPEGLEEFRSFVRHVTIWDQRRRKQAGRTARERGYRGGRNRTPRSKELQVLMSLRAGKTYAWCAREYGISTSTVRRIKKDLWEDNYDGQ
jgi:DNA invertase Pin-like site-specific DNA recombinase